MSEHRKPLTAGQIEELNVAATKFAGHGGKGIFVPDAMRVFELLPRLLSMLTPPPDAAVREAVGYLEGCLAIPVDVCVESDRHLRTILRAVQAPRLTVEQVACVRGAYGQLHGAGRMAAAAWVRAAFPEAFAGEAGNE